MPAPAVLSDLTPFEVVAEGAGSELSPSLYPRQVFQRPGKGSCQRPERVSGQAPQGLGDVPQRVVLQGSAGSIGEVRSQASTVKGRPVADQVSLFHQRVDRLGSRAPGDGMEVCKTGDRPRRPVCPSEAAKPSPLGRG